LESTNPGRGQYRTQGFCLKYVKLFADSQEIAPKQAHLFAKIIDTVLLSIDNQKNGCQGDTLSHHALKDKESYCLLGYCSGERSGTTRNPIMHILQHPIIVLAVCKE